MTDQEVGSPVSDEELVALTDKLKAWSAQEPIKLVLLGDILDLLRSRKWQELWNECGSAPWSAMGRGFPNFRNNHPESCAVEIAGDIAARYKNFSAALKQLAGGNVDVVYIPGNHDFMVQLSPKIRDVVCDFLALKHDPKKPFKPDYEDEDSGIYALHGNKFDPINNHQSEVGHWAFGDAVVLRLVNRFAAEACRALGVAETTAIGSQFHEIDNVEPTYEVPVFVLWLVEEYLTIPSQQKVVKNIWKQMVQELVALDDFRDGYSTEVNRLRELLSASANFTFSEIIAKYAHLMPDTGGAFRRAVEAVAKGFAGSAQARGAFRFIVCGHTHSPMMVPLAASGSNDPMYYVNTGSWRRIVTRPNREHRGPFFPRRVASMFRVDGKEKDTVSGRYHLYQEWHTN